jgi:cardiolipin synthase
MNEYREGNCITLLHCGVEYFPALEAAIDSAQREVHLETYIFADDPSGRQIANALIRAAHRGVRVHVVVDGWGSSGFSGNVLADIAAGGARVAVYRPQPKWFDFRRSRLRRLHRKLAVIDSTVAFVGGINIIDDLNGLDFEPKPPPRFDFAVKVEGPLLCDIYSAAHRLWIVLNWRQMARRRREPVIIEPMPRPCGTQVAAFVTRDNFRSRRDIERGYLVAIHSARDEIVIANAYFFPGRHFRRALLRARRRGVRVTLLLQGKVEYMLLHYASRALYGKLLEAGVEIIEYHGSFLHAKVAVVDRTWATVGSSNIDPFSLWLAREANVFVRDAAFADQLYVQLQTAIKEGARRIEKERWSQRSFIDRGFTWLFYSVVRRLLGFIGFADR